jgi:hypothetical protein
MSLSGYVLKHCAVLPSLLHEISVINAVPRVKAWALYTLAPVNIPALKRISGCARPNLLGMYSKNGCEGVCVIAGSTGSGIDARCRSPAGSVPRGREDYTDHSTKPLPLSHMPQRAHSTLARHTTECTISPSYPPHSCGPARLTAALPVSPPSSLCSRVEARAYVCQPLQDRHPLLRVPPTVIACGDRQSKRRSCDLGSAQRL